MLLARFGAARIDALAAPGGELVVPHPGRGAFFGHGRKIGQKP
jgi:hypothetical protein